MNNTPILPELTDEMTDLEMVEAIDASGVSEELIKRAVAEGYTFIASGVDFRVLADGARRGVEAMRELQR